MENSNKNTGKAENKTGNKNLVLTVSIIVAAVILALAAVFIIQAVLGNDSGTDDPPVTNDLSAVGVYYTVSGKECELTLDDSGEFTLVYDGTSSAGSYILSGAVLTLDFSVEGDADTVASYENGVITLTYRGATVRMLKKVNYTVNFETNGGTEIENITVMNGKNVSKPADPTKDGFIFVGWYKDSAFTQAFTFSSDIVTSDITVYARWIEDTGAREHTVTFELGYAGMAFEPQVTLGGRIFGAPVPERDGFVFGGWWISTDNDPSKLSYKWTEETVFKDNTTLFAVWRELGSTKIEAPSLKIDASGIYWSSVSGARSYDVTVSDGNGTVVFSRATGTESVNFVFADHVAGIYSVKVVANANTGEEDNSESHFTYINKGLDKVSGMFVSGDSSLVFDGVANAEKYLITVVCGNQDHNHTDLDNGNSKIFSFANCPMADEGIKFIVKAVADGYLTSVSDEFVYKRELDAVSGLLWNEETSVVSWSDVANAEYYMVSVVCSDPLHNHGFVNNGGETSVDIKECSSEITVKVYPVTEGYISPAATEIKVSKTNLKTPGGVTFNGTVVGWTSDKGADKYEISVNGTVYESTENQFDLSTVLNSEAGARYEIKLRSIGQTSSVWSNPIICYNLALSGKPTYSNGMLYWDHAVGADFYEIQINSGEISKIYGVNHADITFDRAGENTVKIRFVDGEYHSEWVSLSVIAYAIAFDTLGGSSACVQYKAAGDEISLADANKSGYKFISWYNVPGGPYVNGKEIKGDTFKVTGGITLYAHYTPEKYEITYNYGVGGTGVGAKDTVEYERDYTLEIPTATDITVSFGGWFSAPYGKGTQYTDGSGNSLAPWSAIGGAEVYAFWIDETLTFVPVKVNGKEAYSVSAGPKIALITEVTVPEYYNGLPVAMIDGNAFAGCRSIKKINIPETVEVISNLDPFADCDSLVAINIYDVEGVSSPRYSSENGVLFENRSGETALVRMPMGRDGSYTVPEWTTEISEGAFSGSLLENVVISAEVGKIGTDAFEHCKKLSAVVFAVSDKGGNKELSIGKRAFNGCTALCDIVLPARLTEIDLSKYYIGENGKFTVSGDYAFVGCDSLEVIGVAAGSSTYSVMDGMIYSADKRQLLYCPVSRSGALTLAVGTQSIGAGAFIGCNDITEIVIPNTVTYIGEYAFCGISLQKVTFGGKGFSSVTVGDNAFAECKKLSDVVFEQGSQIAVIGEKCFSGCLALKKFTITSSVTSIRDNAFENCIGLEIVHFDGGKKELEFGTNVFYNCAKLTTVQIPANVSKIPGIFSGCTSLTEVKVDENNPYFISQGGIVFSKDMSEIVYFPQGMGGTYTIPDTVTVIAAGVFSGNKSLAELIIPNTVSYIGKGAFKGTKIGKIVFSGANYADGLTIAESAFENAYFEGYDFVLPSHTMHIEEYAFSGIFYQKIVLNEGLKTIGDYAFYYPSNDNGAALVIPASVEIIGKYCFSGESEDYYVMMAHRFVNVEFTKENSKLTTIGDFAFFKNARLTAVDLPDSVKTIGNYAFYECRNLMSVTLSEELETIGAYAFGASANTYQVPISTLIIPAKVSSIGAHAFEYCQLLTSVTFEGKSGSPDLVLGTTYRRSYEQDGVEMFAIERGYVFASCTRLANVELSPNIIALGDHCFASSGDSGFKVNVPADSRLATIGAFCFYKSRLESFTVPATVRNLAPIEEYGMVFNRLGIGEYAFAASAGKLTEITFLKDKNSYPLTIGYGAFENQSKLESIELPARLASYVSSGGEVIPPLANGPLVFYGARSLSVITAEAGGAYKVEGGVLYTADMKELVFCPVSYIGEVSVPVSVTKIHGYAFSGCSQISAVNFMGKSNLDLIGEYAFYGCANIKSLVLPGSVVSIGEGAFNNNSALESITLSKKLVNFDISILNGCTALRNIFVESGNTSLVSEDGVLYNSGKTALILYPVGRTDKEYTVKESVISIGKYAFCGNGALEVVILPAKLREINEGAFENCSAFKTVVIPNTVEIIGTNAFAYTYSLETITFDKGGQSKLVIADGAFRNSGASVVCLPSRLAAIGAETFSGSKLSALTFEKADSYLITEIGDHAFSGTLLVSVNFPSGIVTVGDGLFLGASSLEDVTFGEGLEEIGAEAFKDSSVKQVALPATLKALGAKAFYNCTSLAQVSFASGAQLKSIEAGTFYGCTSLESITIPAFVEKIGGESSNGAFYNCTSLKTVLFDRDDKCVEIGDYAFYGCSALEAFEIPMSTGTLGNYAFAKCVALKEIVIHRATVKLGKSLFEGCTALANVELDTGADSLPEKMFEGCESLSYIFIPESVAEIGDRCFFGTAIEGFEIAQGNKNFVSVSGIIYNASKTSIVYFPPKLNVKTLIIPKEVVEIKNGIFKGCTGIKEVIFEEGGTVPFSIGNYAFDGCYQLRNVVLPERLVSIGNYAFRNCNALTSITITKNVTGIGDYAFSGCCKLYEVRNESSIENIAKKGSLNYINNNYYVNAKVNIYTPGEGSSILSRKGEFVFATVNGEKRLIGYEGGDSVIALPEGTYAVADYMFCNDDSVTKVIVPRTVSITGSFVFSGCNNLEVILVSGGEIPSSWSDNWNNGKLAFGGYTGKDITYTFVTTQGAMIDPIISADVIKLPLPEIENYIFMGWYDDPGFNGEAVSENYYSADKNTLYARFLTEEEYIELYLRGKSMEYAYAIESGKTYTVEIKGKGTQNYFAVTVDAGETWNIVTPSGMGYHKIWIYDENGKEIFSYYAGATSDPLHDINYDHVFSKGGKYYIGVGYKSSSRESGSFEVTFTKN